MYDDFRRRDTWDTDIHRTVTRFDSFSDEELGRSTQFNNDNLDGYDYYTKNKHSNNNNEIDGEVGEEEGANNNHNHQIHGNNNNKGEQQQQKRSTGDVAGVFTPTPFVYNNFFRIFKVTLYFI